MEAILSGPRLTSALLAIVASSMAVSAAPPVKNEAKPDREASCSSEAIKKGQTENCNPCTSDAMNRGEVVVCEGQNEGPRYRIPDKLRVKPRQ